MKQASTPSATGQANVSHATQLEQQIAVTLYGQGKFEEVEGFCTLLSQRYPQDGFAWKILGAALRQAGRIEEALLPMQNAAKLLPNDWEAYNNLGSTLEALKHLDFADACYRRAIELNPQAVDAISNLAELLLEQGKTEEAVACFRQKLSLRPDDADTRHIIAIYAGEASERAPEGLVTKTFDAYAENFDAHLQGKLQYTVPEDLAALLGRHPMPPEGTWRVLDLGCGTGLMGVLIASKARSLIGVDLSSKMLEKAEGRQVYHRLVCADLLSMMQAEPEHAYEVIVAADVLLYLGRLDDVIQEAKRLLAPGGSLAFSVEHLALESAPSPDEPAVDYHLHIGGRYAHAEHYLQRLAAAHGFTSVEMTRSILRQEAGKPVMGQLVLWRAPN